MEGQVSVDGVLVARTVAVPCKLLNDVLLAVAIVVAIGVEAMLIRGVTGVRGSGPGPLVSLHDVELRAPVAVDLVSVTVAITIRVHSEAAVFILSWHRDKI